jgi:hypothetical protein
MPTNIVVDTAILNDAHKLSGCKTKKETVNMVLEEYAKRNKTDGIIFLFGKVAYEPDFNYWECGPRKR